MILKMADEKSSYGAKRANLSRGGTWMACRTGMTFPWLAESIRVLWVLRFHWLTVPCISQEYPVLHNAGRQQRAQCCSHLHGPQIAFRSRPCGVIIGAVVRTHYRLIAGMSRTFICGTNGLRFKPHNVDNAAPRIRSNQCASPLGS